MKSLSLVVSAFAFLCPAVYAGTIHYTFVGTATGDYNGTSLISDPFTIVLTGDTTARTGTAPAYTLIADTATVVVNGFPMADFSNTMSVYVNGLLAMNSAGNGTLFLGTGPADLISPGGPYGFLLFSHSGQTQFNSVATSLGPLTFSNIAGGTMTVSVDSTAVPEPSTCVLMGGALMGLVFLTKRQRRRIVQ